MAIGDAGSYQHLQKRRTKPTKTDLTVTAAASNYPEGLYFGDGASSG